jgi:adenine-specific DNA-methyltransferase
MTNFDKAFAAVQVLVKKFEAGYNHYMSPKYSEADARNDFINPFFMALGWDVQHTIQTNPYEQEVKIERSQMQQSKDKQINNLVHTIYVLSKEKIKIVERQN